MSNQISIYYGAARFGLRQDHQLPHLPIQRLACHLAIQSSKGTYFLPKRRSHCLRPEGFPDARKGYLTQPHRL